MSTVGDYFQSFGGGSSGPITLTIPFSELSPGNNYFFRVIHNGVQTWHWTTPYSFEIQTIVALPLEWTYWEGSVRGGKVSLIWETSWEENIEEYEVERARDGFHFVTLGRVEAGKFSYDYLDKHPFIGDNYYRLKVIESDGSYYYSDLLQFQVKAQIVLKNVYPNPVEQQLFIDFETADEEPVHVEIYNMLGQAIEQKEYNASFGQNQIMIATHSWESGFYWVELRQGITTEVVKVFKK